MMELHGNPIKIERYNIEGEQWAIDNPELAAGVRHIHSLYEIFQPYSHWAELLKITHKTLGVCTLIPDSSYDFTGFYTCEDFNDYCFIDHLTDYNCQDSFYIYGIADNASQILEAYPDIPDDHIVLMVPIFSKKDEPFSGWRWHKWGRYLGVQERSCEYLNDEPNTDMIYCFSIRQLTPIIEEECEDE